VEAGRESEQPASPLDALVSEAQVLAAPPPPQVPAVMIVANKIDWLVALEEGDVTPHDLETAAWFHLLQAAQARDLGARIVIAEESSHLVMFEQPEVVIAPIADVVNAVRDPSSWATPVADAG
jgi:pimeloyl-ACP methyl ester carboxylesterase